MGCGSSKSVAVADPPTESKSNSSLAPPKPLEDEKSLEQDTGTNGQSLARESTGLAFDVGIEAPKRKPPARFSSQQKRVPEVSEEEIARKLNDAEKRRSEQTKAKLNAVEAGEEKRRRAKQAIQNKKNRANQKLNEMQNEAVKRREEQLKAKATTGTSVQERQKKARARRHEIALQQAATMDVGGEQEDRGEADNNNEEDTQSDGGTQEW